MVFCFIQCQTAIVCDSEINRFRSFGFTSDQDSKARFLNVNCDLCCLGCGSCKSYRGVPRASGGTCLSGIQLCND